MFKWGAAPAPLTQMTTSTKCSETISLATFLNFMRNFVERPVFPTASEGAKSIEKRAKLNSQGL